MQSWIIARELVSDEKVGELKNKKEQAVRRKRSTKSHEAARKEILFRVVSCDFVDRLIFL